MLTDLPRLCSTANTLAIFIWHGSLCAREFGRRASDPQRAGHGEATGVTPAVAAAAWLYRLYLKLPLNP
jgi:hypothetical protein